MNNSDMKLILSKIKRKCGLCAGFGVFNLDKGYELAECRLCHSVHPEQFGLRYEKEGNNYHFYVERSILDKIRGK